MHTVILGKQEGEGDGLVANYLNATKSGIGKQQRLVRDWASQRLAAEHHDAWDLVLCHRYRSIRAAGKLPVPQHRVVGVAHEFGLMQGWRRRLYRSLPAAIASRTVMPNASTSPRCNK